MSGQVEKVPPQFSVDTICPIVINPKEGILTFKSSTSVFTPSAVSAGFSGCHPIPESFMYVYTESQVNVCCGVQNMVRNVSPRY